MFQLIQAYTQNYSKVGSRTIRLEYETIKDSLVQAGIQKFWGSRVSTSFTYCRSPLDPPTWYHATNSGFMCAEEHIRNTRRTKQQRPNVGLETYPLTLVLCDYVKKN